MFIVITGLDGSGTSTVARKLCELDKNSIVLKTPSEEFEKSREAIDTTVRNTSSIAHYLYYLSSVVYMSDYIKGHIDYKEKNVYCVRYLIDTIVSHRVAGIDVKLDYDLYNILKPDLTIFVKLNETIRQRRITERGKSILDAILDDSATREKFLNIFDEYSKEFVVFENDSEDLENNIRSFYERYIRR